MAVSGPHDELLPLLDALAFCSEPMFAISERHRVVFWNKPLQLLLGWSYDEVVGRSCGQVLCGTDAFGNRYCTDPCPVISIAQRGQSLRRFGLAVRAKSGQALHVDIGVIRFTLPQTKRPVLAHVVQLAQEASAEEVTPPQSAFASHSDARVRQLTAREVEVLSMVVAGQNAGHIADRLGISLLTARNHIQHVFEKLEVHSKSEAVAFAYRMHLV